MRRIWVLLFACLLAIVAVHAHAAAPNVVLILCDDLGYGDLTCYGNEKLRTPNIDRLAREGVRFTDFYAAGTQCSPSRAGMLTGRYPVRFGLTGSLMANAGAGISASETILPQRLRTLGYATMLAGKWHLGDQPKYHPQRHGFDHFEGLLRGHDTDPREYWRDDRIVDRGAPLDTLTARYTEAAVAFVRTSARAKRPFFLMLAHTSPHTPLAPGAAFRGKSGAGAYGDCVEEIDDSVGRVLAALAEAGVDKETLVFFSSDNGPSVDKGKEGGSTGPLRAGKYSTYEGGIRVPAVAWWPGRIKPRVETGPAILLDVCPTVVSLAGGTMTGVVDGRDLSPVLLGTGRRDGEDFFFYLADTLEAHRSGDWKLKLGEQGGQGGQPMLFNLRDDLAEQHDLAARHPEIVTRLRAQMTRFEASVR